MSRSSLVDSRDSKHCFVVCMIIGTADLYVLLRLKEEGRIPDRASIIEIGAQQLANSFLEARQKIETAGRYFRARGDLRLPKPTPAVVAHGMMDQLDPGAPPAREF